MSEDRISHVDEKERRHQQYLMRKRKHQQKQAIVFGSLALVLLLLIILLCKSCSGKNKTVQQPTKTPQQTKPQSISMKATVLTVGDNLLHQQILNYCASGGGYDFSPLFADLKEEISAADLACLSQETILVKDSSDVSNNISCYGTIADFADDAAAAGFDVSLQATEHAYDKLMKGIQNTVSKWDSLGVACMGIHAQEENPERYFDVNGIRIAMFNYTYYTPDTEKPENAFAIDYIGEDEKMDIAADIARAKQNSDIVLVFAHWGAIGDYEPNEFQTTWAKFFADNGVGAVIGTHSHVVQRVEEITRADGGIMPVYYSLGNYMTHMNEYYNMLGGMAKLTITKDSHGTYVSEYQMIPLVEHITENSDGTYAFRVVKLEDYRAELAQTHQFPKASVANMVELWETIPGAETTKPLVGTITAPEGEKPMTDWSTQPLPEAPSMTEAPSETEETSTEAP